MLLLWLSFTTLEAKQNQYTSVNSKSEVVKKYRITLYCFMDILHHLLHIDQTLLLILNKTGAFPFILVILSIVFLESACILMPFLPGDSLLMTTGLLAAQQSIPITGLYLSILATAITGYIINYQLACFFKKRIEEKKSPQWQKIHHRIHEAKNFYQRFGYSSLFIARFIPIIRTFLPFAAGLMGIPKKSFYFFNIFGSTLWVTSLLLIPYHLGHIHWVQVHTSFLIHSVMILSICPLFLWALRAVIHIRNKATS